MAESRYIPLRTDKFRIAYEAMRGIASKTLPPESETKLALLVKGYEKIYDATTEALKKNELANGRKIGMRTVMTPLGEARRERITAVLLQIKLPPKDCLIKKSDLPKRDEDALDKDIDNRQATAFLVSQLGPFYDHEATGEKKEVLETDLDAESLAALEAANSDEIEVPKGDLMPDTDKVVPLAPSGERISQELQS